MTGQISRGISPYLTVEGAPAAIEFYKAVFGAQELGRHMVDDGRRVMHCALRINGGTVMLADSIPGHDDYPRPTQAAARRWRSALSLPDLPRSIGCMGGPSTMGPRPSWTRWTPSGARVSPC